MGLADFSLTTTTSGGGGGGVAHEKRWRDLPQAFYERHSLQVAQDLLGKIIWVQTSEGVSAGRILETEAYRGADDPASHAARGRTPRSSVMFGPPGRAYVYWVYGLHSLLNLVTEPEGQPGAVLLRALEPLLNPCLMSKRRGGRDGREGNVIGPARLSQALGVGLVANGLRVCGKRQQQQQDPKPALRIRVLCDGFHVPQFQVTSRIGVASTLPWRFVIGSARLEGVPREREGRVAHPTRITQED